MVPSFESRPGLLHQLPFASNPRIAYGPLQQQVRHAPGSSCRLRQHTTRTSAADPNPVAGIGISLSQYQRRENPSEPGLVASAKHGSKPPPPKLLFTDSDPNIEKYSNLYVSVTDTLLAELEDAGNNNFLARIEQAPSPTGPAAATAPAAGGRRQPRTCPQNSSTTPITSFNVLATRPFWYSLRLRKNMVEAGYQLPTPIQQYSIPVVNAGRDMLATAHTGSGKTAAYLVPVLGSSMKTVRSGQPRNSCYPWALILCPTRELAGQVMEELQRLIKRTHLKPVLLAGGGLLVDQVFAMRGGADIIVATPGRLMDHLARRVLKLDHLRLLVIDDADKMMDLGFEPELRRLVTHRRMPSAPERQTLMLSATLPEDVQRLAADLLHHHVHVQVGIKGT